MSFLAEIDDFRIAARQRWNQASTLDRAAILYRIVKLLLKSKPARLWPNQRQLRLMQPATQPVQRSLCQTARPSPRLSKKPRGK